MSSFLSDSVGPAWNCPSECSTPSCGCATYFKVIDVIFDVVGTTFIGIGALLYKSKQTMSLIFIAVGIALLAIGIANTFLGFWNP